MKDEYMIREYEKREKMGKCDALTLSKVYSM